MFKRCQHTICTECVCTAANISSIVRSQGLRECAGVCARVCSCVTLLENVQLLTLANMQCRFILVNIQCVYICTYFSQEIAYSFPHLFFELSYYRFRENLRSAPWNVSGFTILTNMNVYLNPGTLIKLVSIIFGKYTFIW